MAEPDLIHSRPNLDFGRGFYVTPLYEQAWKWCGKFKCRGKDGIVSQYAFDESREPQLKTLKFDSYSEDWLDFILNCRSGKDTTDYDLVAGGAANDKDNLGLSSVKTCPVFRSMKGAIFPVCSIHRQRKHHGHSHRQESDGGGKRICAKKEIVVK